MARKTLLLCVRSAVENLKGPVGFAADGQLLQAGEEAAFVAECGGVIVVRMASFPIGKDNRVRAQFADDLGEAQLVLASGLDIGIRHAESVAPGDAQNLRGTGGFFCSGFWRAARSHFALGQIEDAGFVTKSRHF